MADRQLLIGRVLAFKGEDDVVTGLGGHGLEVLVEVTDALADGTVELLVELPLRTVDKLYVRFTLADVVARALALRGAPTS